MTWKAPLVSSDYALRPLRDPNMDWSFRPDGLKSSWKDLPVKCKPRGTAEEFAEARERADDIVNRLLGKKRAPRIEAILRQEPMPQRGTPEYVQWLAKRSGKPTDQILREIAAE